MFSENSQAHPSNSNSPEQADINLLLPDGWNRPLWKRLLGEARDKFAPEKLPPLELTSRPVDVGMIESDRLSLPWYRTVFTNLGDVVSPETLPPLELESTPVDVGELIADQMSHPWWTSLLRSLADAAAPERMPPLQLTSKPMDPGMGSDSMLLPRWSSVISTPKVFLPDKPKTDLPAIPLRVAPKPKPDPIEVEIMQILQTDLKRDIASSIFRQRIWISLAVLELGLLFVTGFWWK
jgi:hypothetical protein